MYNEDYEVLKERFTEISKENNTRSQVLAQIKERVNQELLDNLSGLENVDGSKLLTDLVDILSNNNV